MILFNDLETFSEVSLDNGSHAYAAHPSAEVLLWGYAIDDQPAKVWDVSSNAPMPDDLKAALDKVAQLKCSHVWHNGLMFDTVFLHYAMPNIKLPLATLIDTRVLAYQAALPGGLGNLCTILKIEQDKAKDKDGTRLIRMFCKPQPSSYKNRRCTRITNPNEWAMFKHYCQMDIEALRAVYQRLPKFNDTDYEHVLQMFDAHVNRRGMCIDTDLARGAIAVAEQNKELLNQKTAQATDGEVLAATQRDALAAFLERKYKVKPTDMSKGTLMRLVDDESLPEMARELIRLRLQSAKTSVKKYKVALDASVNGRLRGTLQFRGAARTGRMSGQLFQPQNLPRPSMSNAEIDKAIEAIKQGRLIENYENPSDVLANCIRGLIIAPEGKKLCVADYSNVEGRVLAWLSGEEWKLKAFREFDQGIGHDLYRLTYGRTFNVRPEAVTKQQRQMGKVLELALGYSGGPGAFVTFAQVYGMNLSEQTETIRQTISPVLWNKASDKYEWSKQKGITAGLNKDTWTACEAVKLAWRQANSKIVRFWSDLAEAAKAAISNRDRCFTVGFVTFGMYGGYLVARLPSRRFLSYPSPCLDDSGQSAFTFMGINQYTKRWERISTFSGKLAENLTQAVACDLLMEAGPRLEAKDYKVVLSIHDEYICECDLDKDYREMEAVMSQPPVWAAGLPLVAKGFEAQRYRKE